MDVLREIEIYWKRLMACDVERKDWSAIPLSGMYSGAMLPS